MMQYLNQLLITGRNKKTFTVLECPFYVKYF